MLVGVAACCGVMGIHDHCLAAPPEQADPTQETETDSICLYRNPCGAPERLQQEGNLMGIIRKFLGSSPFGQILEHTKKVHACVELLRPLSEALLEENYDVIAELHHQMSQTEHEADQIKTEIRDTVSSLYMISIGRYELMNFVSYQDSVADAAEDYAVVLLIRKTRIPSELREDFRAYVDQVIQVSEHLLALCKELNLLAESAFAGKEAEKFFQNIDEIGEEEWKCDKLQRTLAKHAYEMEDQIDPTTLRFIDKYCQTLGDVANSAEKTAKYLRQIIGQR
jgi:uncharacterized protein